MIPRKAQRSEVLVEISAGALAKEPVEGPALLLLDDGLLLFARLDDCFAAIDIGLGVGSTFRTARRIILARNGRLLACKSGRYAGGGCHDQQNTKESQWFAS